MLRLALVFVLMVTAFPDVVQAQSGDCDRVAVEEWARQRQVWRTATQETLDAHGVSPASALLRLSAHLQAIEDLDRPGCADNAMLWTYYLYTNMQHLLICAQNGQSACVTEMQGRLVDYRSRDEQVMNALVSGVGLPLTVLRPPTPIPPPTSTPAPQTKRLGPMRNAYSAATFSVEVSVVDTRFLRADGYSQPKAGFIYVVVDLQVKNLGPGALTSISPLDFQIRDANGALRTETWLFDSTSSCHLDLVDLMAGGSVSGCVAFEVPGTGKLELIYAPYRYEGLEEGRYLAFTLR